MAIKSVNFVIAAGGLGVITGGGSETIAVIGVTSAGTANQIIESVDPSAFTTSDGYGPAVQAAGYVAKHSGAPTILIKAATVTPGTNTPVSHTGTGTSVVTITGTPLDTYYALLTPVTGGTIGVTGPVIDVSLDAGRTVAFVINLGTANSYVIPNTGLTVNFAAGTLVALDTYSWYSVEPKASDATVQSAIQALLGTTTAFKNILVVGDIASGDFAALDTQMTNLLNHKRFSRAFTNSRDVVQGGVSTETEAVWIASISADFAGVASDRISVSAGFYNVISPYDQCQYRRPLSWVAAGIDAVATVGQDISAVAPNGAATPLSMISKPSIADGYEYYDAQANPALDTARFLTAQQLFGLPGWYMTNSNMMAAPGSDFTILPYCEVVDETCFVAYQFFVTKLGGSVRVNKTTGFILDADANDIDARCTAMLKAALGGGVSSVVCKVNRTSNILSTKQLLATISIVPLGYINSVTVTITLVNPALTVVP